MPIKVVANYDANIPWTGFCLLDLYRNNNSNRPLVESFLVKGNTVFGVVYYAVVRKREFKYVTINNKFSFILVNKNAPEFSSME